MQTSSRDLPAPNFFFVESRTFDNDDRTIVCRNSRDVCENIIVVPDACALDSNNDHNNDDNDNNEYDDDVVVDGGDDDDNNENDECGNDNDDGVMTGEMIDGNNVDNGDGKRSKNNNSNDNSEIWSYPLFRTTFLFESEKCTHIFTNSTIQLRSGDEAESIISICDLCGFKKIKN